MFYFCFFLQSHQYFFLRRLFSLSAKEKSMFIFFLFKDKESYEIVVCLCGIEKRKVCFIFFHFKDKKSYESVICLCRIDRVETFCWKWDVIFFHLCESANLKKKEGVCSHEVKRKEVYSVWLDLWNVFSWSPHFLTRLNKYYKWGMWKGVCDLVLVL